MLGNWTGIYNVWIGVGRGILPEYTHLLKHIKFSKLLVFLEISLFPNFPSSSNPKFSMRLKSPCLLYSPKPPISLTSSYEALKHSTKFLIPPKNSQFHQNSPNTPRSPNSTQSTWQNLQAHPQLQIHSHFQSPGFFKSKHSTSPKICTFNFSKPLISPSK